MMPVRKIITITQLIVVLLGSAAIKLYYSAASVNDLLWVLAPTRFLVELATGVRFTFESYSGYMSSDHSFVIAAACSGVNFLITAFLMLTVARIWKYRDRAISWTFIPLSLLFAYLTTIVANTVRISIALFIRRQDPELIWLNPEEIHRFEGIVVYFGFLMLLFVLSERLSSDESPRPMRKCGFLRRALLPLAIYYAITIGVPLANGAYHRGPAASEFWLHSLFVLITPLTLLVPIALINYVRDLRGPIGKVQDYR